MAATSSSWVPPRQIETENRLFPLLKQIHALPNLPTALHGLTFPELLLEEVSPTSQPYLEGDLERDHPIFSALNHQIKILQTYQSLSPVLFNELAKRYQNYIEEVISLKGEERQKVLSGPSRLFALLNKESVSLFLTQNSKRGVTSVGTYPAADPQTISFFAEEAENNSKILERIFFSAFSDELIKIKQCSLRTAIKLWITPQKQWTYLELLFTTFPTSSASDAPKLTKPPLAFHRHPNFNRLDRRRSAPLHLAAESNNLEDAKELVRRGAEIDIKNLDGRTPLHLAIIQGHFAMVDNLIALGADPNLTTFEGEAALHLAAAGGHLNIVALLLQHPSSPHWLHQADSNGKIPLHRAVSIRGNPEVVDTLIKAGTQVNTPNRDGDTALHGAAKHGLVESARLLLNAGAQIDRVNQNGKNAFDLAFDWGQDSILALFLSDRATISPLSSSSTPPPLEEEGAIYRAFEAAYEAGDSLNQVLYLEKTAQIYLKKRDYFTAAHLLNSALSLPTTNLDPKYSHFIVHQLEKIEQLFITEKLGYPPPPSESGYLIKRREQLVTIRAEIAHRLKRRERSDEILKILTTHYKNLLISIIEESINSFTREKAKKFAVMGLGSMAREEMSPYSDLEFAFLIHDPSLERRDYFRALAEIVTLKLVNMGETKCEILRFKRMANGEDRLAKSFIQNGFSVDIGGLCPTGKKGVYELIGSPKELAQFQTEEWLRNHDAEVILVNAMTTSCFVMGDPNLVKTYKQEVNKVLNASIGASSSTSPAQKLRQVRALEFMRGYVDEFAPRLNEDKIDLRGFDVKKELYRPLQTVISGLALYYGSNSDTTLKKISNLSAKRIINASGAAQLRKTLQAILRLRIETHLFYKSEKEVLYHSRGVADSSADGLFIISPDLSRELLEIYQSLIPLHRCALAFINGDERAFAESLFLDKKVGTYDDSQREALQFDSALSSAESSTALNPNDSSLRWDLGRVELDLGQAQRAVKSFKETLALLKTEHRDQPHLDIVGALNNLGAAYHDLGKFTKAAEKFKESLEMLSHIPEAPRSRVANTLGNLGNAYQRLGLFPLAIDHHGASLSLFRVIHCDQPHRDIIKGLVNLGNSYRGLGEIQQASDNLTLALKIQGELYKGQPHPEAIALSLAVGSLYRERGQLDRAYEHLNKSYYMCLSVYRDRNHPDYFMTLHNLGNVLMEQEKPQEALILLEQALKRGEQLHQESSHPDVGKSHYSLGICYFKLKKLSEAAKHLSLAVSIFEAAYPDRPHADTTQALMNLGGVYSAFGDFGKAMSSLNSALEMLRKIHHSTPHQDIANILNNLGAACTDHNQLDRAIDYYRSALDVYKELGKGQLSSSSSNTLRNLATLYDKLNYLPEAIECYKLYLSFQKEINQNKPHPNIAFALVGISSAYHRMGDLPQAVPFFQELYQLQVTTMGAHHPSTIKMKESLDVILREASKG